MRDLRVCSQAHDAEVYHYRGNTGLEVHAIVETAAGAWMAIEIQLGGGTAAPLRTPASRLDRAHAPVSS